MITFLREISNRIISLLTNLTLGPIFWSIMAIFAISTSFFLGRLSTILEQKPIFEISEMKNKNSTFIDDNRSNPNLGKIDIESELSKYSNTDASSIMASKKGKKYYFLWCSGGANIKESNKIYFTSEDTAKASGRSLASGCK